MSPKVIAGLAALTLVTLVAAVLAAVAQPDVGEVQVVDKPAFPALRAQPDTVAKVTIRGHGQSATLERTAPDRWVAPGRAGYPVATGDVRELIVRLADMRLIERKTANPERFARLEVEDVEAEGARSRLVRLEDAAGRVLAEAIIGKRRQRLTGALPSGTYLRRPGERQSWLASGGPEVQTAVEEWLDQGIVDLAGEDVRQIEVQPADGPAYAIVRDAPGGALRLEDLQDGEVLGADADLDSLAGSLAGLKLEDVKPAGELAWPAGQHRVRFATFDGLRITLGLAEMDDGRWLRIEASTALATASSGAAGASEAAPVAEEAKNAPGVEPAPTSETSEGPSAGERAQAISARTEGWAYRIPPYVFERLIKPREAWLARPDETS